MKSARALHGMARLVDGYSGIMRLPLHLTPLLGSLALMGCSGPPPSETSAPSANVTKYADFAGSLTCIECHAEQAELWTGSHHDLAMQTATEATVLGDFDDATMEHFGVVSQFTRKGSQFIVRTQGPNGENNDYPVRYVFGVHPLQQYLVEFPGGRLQTLPTAFDTRAATEGGQRWFHIYPDEPILPGDELHWTGANQNWNFMCAACHSTGYQKNYDLRADEYEATWVEEDVSCEACHGPAESHVRWARAGANPDRHNGLTLSLRDESGGTWAIDEATGNALRSTPRSSRAQSETCARCHSRRSVLNETPVDGSCFHDNYRLSLLEPNLYFADGQIQDEVYVYASFLQSKMHAEGVTCSDCHDPHSAKLRFEGNALCAQCHSTEKYDTPAHHHHKVDGPGAQCVACHMPERTYMVVDPRRDHSLRVPRPDLSVQFGTPNACTPCHADQGPVWAADAVRTWFPEGRSGKPHFAHALHAGRTGMQGAGSLLATIAATADQPPIVRATALSMLPAYVDQDTFPVLAAGLTDPHPLVRASAVSGLQVLPMQERVNLAFSLLEDPVRLVRIEAARTLASFTSQELPDLIALPLQAALAELNAAEVQSAERASARVNLAQVATEQKLIEAAIAHLRRGRMLEPYFVPVYVNLADLYRRQGDEQAAEEALRAGLKQAPASAALHHAFGLLLARTDRIHEALVSLDQAVGLAPGEARFAYAHALALDGVGNRTGALDALARAQQRHPFDREILQALATLHRDAGHREVALTWARKLLDISPGDEGVGRLVSELSQED